MNKIMKLEVIFESYYNDGFYGVLLLPNEVNGVLFGELQEQTYEEMVYLGEIEGKHSECYGDLRVSFIDLEETSSKVLSDLIDESNFFSNIEWFFEDREYDFQSNPSYNKEKIKKILSSYSIESPSSTCQTKSIYNRFVDHLKQQYKMNYKSISLLETDYDRAISLLTEHNIQLVR